MVILETKRLLLREMNPADYDALYAILADSDIMRHYPYTFDQARVRNWIARNMDRYRIFGFGLWAVALKTTGEMMGDCGLTMQSIDGFIRPEIGYHIHRQHQRRGYATEAGTACRDWAFLHTPFRVLYSYMKETNTPSAATAAAMGMKQVETYIDAEHETSVVYAIAREDWESLRAHDGIRAGYQRAK